MNTLPLFYHFRTCDLQLINPFDLSYKEIVRVLISTEIRNITDLTPFFNTSNSKFCYQ